MRDKPVFTQYSDDRRYRYTVYDRLDNTYAVWVQQKITDTYMGNDWYTYTDMRDSMHLADSMERAIEIGDEALLNLL